MFKTATLTYNQYKSRITNIRYIVHIWIQCLSPLCFCNDLQCGIFNLSRSLQADCIQKTCSTQIIDPFRPSFWSNVGNPNGWFQAFPLHFPFTHISNAQTEKKLGLPSANEFCMSGLQLFFVSNRRAWAGWTYCSWGISKTSWWFLTTHLKKYARQNWNLPQFSE